MKHTEPTVTARRSNQIRNLGKERSAEMHAKAADKIDRQNTIAAKSKNGAAAKAERLAKNSAS